MVGYESITKFACLVKVCKVMNIFASLLLTKIKYFLQALEDFLSEIYIYM